MASRNKDDFYTRPLGRTTQNSVYTGSPYGTEVNMRSEFVNTMDGLFPEISKASIGILRRMRRDNEGQLIKCPCVDKMTAEGDRDRWCPICFSSNYLNDEIFVQYYRTIAGLDTSNALRDKHTQPGLINIPVIVFYIRYDALITRQDEIVEILRDNEGEPVQPLQRTAVYQLGTLWDYRSDNGRLEYYKAFAHEATVKYINAPLYGSV